MKNWREDDCGGGGGGVSYERGETRHAWFELRVGSFAMRRTRTVVPYSVRAGAALLNGGETATTGKASEWLMRALPMSLTGTVTFRARWLVAAQRADGSTSQDEV